MQKSKITKMPYKEIIIFPYFHYQFAMKIICIINS